MTKLTINKDLNGIELSFNSKPEAATLDALKAAGFRWHGVKKVWYAKQTPERLTLAKSITGEQIEATQDAPKAAKVDVKAMLTEEFRKAWSSEKMISYCVNSVAAFAELPGGELITVEKEGVKTRFCFGESGYDFDDAAKMAQHARTSEEYFKDENMEHFRRWLNDLEEAKNLNKYVLTIHKPKYTGQTESCRLAGIEFYRLTEILDACGGSACLEELPGKTLKVYGRECRVATAEDINLIIEAFKTAATAHEKKIDSYLKRYGTSKVYSWTYWREA